MPQVSKPTQVPQCCLSEVSIPKWCSPDPSLTQLSEKQVKICQLEGDICRRTARDQSKFKGWSKATVGPSLALSSRVLLSLTPFLTKLQVFDLCRIVSQVGQSTVKKLSSLYLSGAAARVPAAGSLIFSPLNPQLGTTEAYRTGGTPSCWALF